MLLAFPLQHVHSSLFHFRSHEVRRSVVSHTPLAPTSETSTVEEAYKYPADFAGPVEDCSEPEPAIKIPTLPTIPVKLFLTRLKLGPAPAGGQDPLLH